MRFNEGERWDERRREVQHTPERIQGCSGVTLRQADHGASVVDGTHLPLVNDAYLLGGGGEFHERCARLILPPKASLRGREPAGDPRRESVHTTEERLRPRCRCEFFVRGLLLPATRVQHARRHMQKHRRGWVDLCL